jgi:hypothetical protein
MWYRGAQGWEPLTNFAASIVKEVIRDDGAEERGEPQIAGTLANGEPLGTARVPLGSFPGMAWVPAAWGSRAVVEAGAATRDRVRVAIQRLSTEVVRRRVYGHTGFRRIDGERVYLHAGGAIGARGALAGIEVELDGRLGRAVLPEPPAGDALRTAVQASLGLLKAGPGRIMAPVLGGVYRAPLCAMRPVDLAVHLHGTSGVFKTELAALAQAHYGDFDRLTLPGAWSSTGNSLELLVFLAKDMLVVIDDFAPSGTTHEIARYHANADRVIRAVGNQAGRGRMRPDGSLRPAYAPRGLVLSTGEDVPRGHSLGARQLVVEVGRGDVDRGRLSAAQEQAAQGVFAQAMSGYIQWLCGHFDDVEASLLASFTALRDKAQAAGLHARLPAAQAHLLVGWDIYLRFATECGAITREESAALAEGAAKALAALAVSTQQQVADQEPAARALRLLCALLSTGKAHLAGANGGEPPDAERWGWRLEQVGENAVWRSSRQHVGWIDGEEVYLQPEASYAAVRAAAQAQGSDLGVLQRTLWKRWREKGWLALREGDRNHVERVLGGTRQPVLHLHSRLFEAPLYSAQETGFSGLSGLAAQSTRENAPGDGSSRPDSSPPRPDSSASRPDSSDGFGTPPANGRTRSTREEASKEPQSPESPESPVFRELYTPIAISDECAADGEHLDGEWACIGCGAPLGLDERLCPGCTEDLGRAAQGAAAPVQATSNGACTRWQGAVRNVSRERTIQHPTEPCARGHHDWIFARSEDEPAWYGYVCRHPECLPSERYGCWLPAEACTEVSL